MTTQSSAVAFAIRTRAAINAFRAKIETGEIVLPPDASDASESPKVQWPNSIVIDGKYYETDYDEATNTLTLADEDQ